MIERGTLWPAAGFAAALFLTGIPYWRLPYNADFFSDPLMLAGFVGVAVVSAVLAASGAVHLGKAFWVMLAAFPVAVMIRVIIDTAKDPTDHNLWPFELIIAAVISLVAVVLACSPARSFGGWARSPGVLRNRRSFARRSQRASTGAGRRRQGLSLPSAADRKQRPRSAI